VYVPGKLKEDRSIAFLLPALVTLALFLVALAAGGPPVGWLVLGLAFALFALLAARSYRRTRNSAILVQTAYLGLAAAWLVTSLPRLGSAYDPRLHRFIGIGLIVSTVWLAYVFFNRKLKWRGREILELAALPVKPVPDAFTGRPRPAGRAEYTRGEILSFADLLHRNHLAWAYREADRVVLSPVKAGKEYPYLYGWSVPDYQERTWVAFDFDGNVSAHVSREDYLDFREELSLDALCESLAGLFVGFLEQFQKGEARRIVERLDAVSLSPVS
jgi:hypothetical protein